MISSYSNATSIKFPLVLLFLQTKAIREFTLLFTNSLLSLKAKRRCKLNPELRIYNREINKRRIGIEHVFGKLKTFKILAGRYRSRDKRLGLRFNCWNLQYGVE
ncbi:transposase family protein [Acinetobacter brisouii]|uniref:transposase family protein n=1 Tax=Acinetobacter brisouii TaxID=396323 RepID=UPI00157B47F6|nr:transposase family protein [Acinetobacter brisouii]